jgi:hypothetical protein
MTTPEVSTPTTPEVPAEAVGKKATKPKRRRARFVAISVLAAAGGVLWVCLFGNDRVTRPNYARIRPGITMEQVSVILGPQRELTVLKKSDRIPVELHVLNPSFLANRFPPDHHWQRWSGQDHVISVAFDSSGAAVAKTISSCDPNRTDGLFGRFQRYWRQWFGEGSSSAPPAGGRMPVPSGRPILYLQNPPVYFSQPQPLTPPPASSAPAEGAKSIPPAKDNLNE